LRTWLALSLIVLGGVVLRLTVLERETRDATRHVWIDPDRYTSTARLLNPTGDDWTWSLEAVRYFSHLKAPAYPVFLSWFVPSARYRYAAAAGQILVGGLAIVGAYLLGDALAGRRAGLIAAIVWALWLADIVAADVFMQERLYVPLLALALGLLARAVSRNRGALAFGVAGLALGTAALARSMPLYYAPLAAGLLLAASPNRRHALRQAAGFLVGVLLVSLPYVVFISLQAGRFVPIENISSHALWFNYRSAYESVLQRPGPATTVEASRVLWHVASSAPLGFARQVSGDVLAMFWLAGGRWLTEFGRVGSPEAATTLKAVTHLLGDLPFAAVVVLAPLGWAQAPGRRAANLVGCWVLVHLLMTTTVGYVGPRFRWPIDPLLVALATVVVAGTGLDRRRWRLAAGGVCAALLAVVVFTSVPRALSGRPSYGIGHWSRGGGRLTTCAADRAGFYVRPRDGALTLSLWPGPDARTRPVSVEVFLDGEPAQNVELRGSRPQSLRLPWRSTRPAYVEVNARPATGKPRTLGLGLIREPRGPRGQRRPGGDPEVPPSCGRARGTRGNRGSGIP